MSFPASVELSEWGTLGPDNCSTLKDRFIDTSIATHPVVKRLADSRLLGLTELRTGLRIEAYSHVGRLRVGDLTVTVLPKIKGASLLRLLRYAYGFRQLNLMSASDQHVDDCGFEDLLINQLNAEVQELVSRGLRRSYIATSARLSSPRGRLDLARLALDGGTITATLPCVHHPRTDDSLLNRALLAGLRLAASMSDAVHLARESRRLASSMEEQVAQVALNRDVLDRAERQISRLTTAYAPSMSIIRLLLEAKGVVLEGSGRSTSVSGFLFDMNAFFQAILLRFLRENLPGCAVDERGLKGMLRYDKNFNPKGRVSPTPRPDYVVTRYGAVRALLDAKYRDLWEASLPREMLYQLVVYAISQRLEPRSTILYPTTIEAAKEARIDVSDPMSGKHLGQIRIRPVGLARLGKLLAVSSPVARRERESYARWLVFGDQTQI